ncbi:MAG: response regulator [Pseudomonadales bacterium]|nr:response regulator [Pseudomonadales bacterium]
MMIYTKNYLLKNAYTYRNHRYSALILLTMTFFLCLNIVFLSVNTHAQNLELYAEDLDSPIRLSAFMSYQTYASDDFEVIRDYDTRRWNSLQGNVNLGYQLNPYWFNVPIKAMHDIDVVFDIVDIYILQDNKLVKTFKLGDLQRFSDKPIKSNNLQVPLRLLAGKQYQIYWYIEGKGTPLQFRAQLLSPSDASQNHLTIAIFYAAFLGATLIIALYNLFLFVSTRQFSFLIYSFLVSSLCFSMLGLQGYLEQFLWPNTVVNSAHFLMVNASIYRILSSLFVLSFLQINRKNTRFSYGFYAFLLMDSALLIQSLFFSEMSLFALSVISSALIAPFSLFVSLWMWFKGHRNARFMALAWAVYTPTMVYYFVSSFGFGQYQPQLIHVVTFSIASQMILLAVALADRLNLARHNEKKVNDLKQRITVDKQKLLAVENDLLASQLRELEVEEKNKAKSQFLSTMSHEIRTPMNGVLGMAELLGETDLNDKQQRLVKIIQQSGNALLLVINDILDYSKIESGTMTLESVDFNLEELLDSCIEIFTLQTQEKHLLLMSCIESDVPLMQYADATRLRQILINLIGNAVKFTSEGEVCIKVSACYENEDKAKGGLPPDTIQFAISDTGIGINTEQKQKLFEAFTQMDTTTTRRFGGTGLGLSICKRLLDLMGGSIDISSEASVGTTLICRIPFHASTQKVISQEPENTEVLLAKRLLIIDDNRHFSEFCQISCQNWGLQVDIAEDGATGMHKLKTQAAYDLVLIDIMLPDTDGYRLSKSIEEESQIVHKPAAIFISAQQLHHTDMTEMIRAQLHQHVYLEKPLASHTLREALVKVLEYADNPNQHLEKTQLSANVIQLRRQKALPDLSFLRVLVTDDNAVNRMVVAGQLKKMHIKAIFAEDGEEALSLVQAHSHFDLILMDLEMPNMDGYQCSLAIRKLEETRHGSDASLIIALSAMLNEDVENKVMAAGMNGFMGKPIGLHDLADHILAYLHSSGRYQDKVQE